MNEDFERFLLSPEQDRKNVFGQSAIRPVTRPKYIEKDFWVCFVLYTLFNRLPSGQPRLLFKGGTPLSKAFGLIERFSEDVDLVVYREDLEFSEDRDPTAKGTDMSNTKRKILFE